MTRPRLFQVLIAISLLSLGLLGYALIKERTVRTQVDLGLLLPALSDRFSDVASIDVTFGLGMSGTQTVSIRRQNDKWVLPSRQNYPANQELVNEVVLNLAAIEKIAPRTAIPKWHSRLGLTHPEKLGAAIRFELRDASGQLVAGVLLGKPEASEVEQKQAIQQIGLPQSNFYIREIDQDQTWLARGRLPRNKDFAAWIDADLPLPDLTSVETLVISGDGAVSLSASEEASKEILGGLSALRPVDVTPAELINFEQGRALKLVHRDGAETDISAVSTGSHLWARFSTGPDWAYKFDGSAAAALMPIVDKNQD